MYQYWHPVMSTALMHSWGPVIYFRMSHDFCGVNATTVCWCQHSVMPAAPLTAFFHSVRSSGTNGIMIPTLAPKVMWHPTWFSQPQKCNGVIDWAVSITWQGKLHVPTFLRQIYPRTNTIHMPYWKQYVQLLSADQHKNTCVLSSPHQHTTKAGILQKTTHLYWNMVGVRPCCSKVL